MFSLSLYLQKTKFFSIKGLLQKKKKILVCLFFTCFRSLQEYESWFRLWRVVFNTVLSITTHGECLSLASSRFSRDGADFKPLSRSLLGQLICLGILDLKSRTFIWFLIVILDKNGEISHRFETKTFFTLIYIFSLY